MDPGPQRHATPIRVAARVLLAVFLLTAGIGHVVAHEAFLAQVPEWLPVRSAIVYVSGAIEVAFAVALLLWRRRRSEVGWALAAFFVLIFPGNIYQAVAGTEAFGLDSATARWVRLAFQPLLIAWAVWCTRE